MLFSLYPVVFAVLVDTGDALQWNQCGNKNSIIVNDPDLTPSPLKMQGASKLTMEFTILKQLNGSDAEITVKRNTLLGWIRVPCLFEVGSCTYKDTCSLMRRMMEGNWGGCLGPIVTQLLHSFNEVGAKMACPVPAQHFRLENVELALPKVAFYIKVLPEGEDNIKFHTKDMVTKQSILSLEWDMAVA